jgi:hypothetical protein
VLRWVEHLHSHERVSSLIHDLLEFIINHLLVVDPMCRIRANLLEKNLQDTIRKAEYDDRYLLQPVTRKPTSRGRSVLKTLPSPSHTLDTAPQIKTSKHNLKRRTL